MCVGSGVLCVRGDGGWQFLFCLSVRGESCRAEGAFLWLEKRWWVGNSRRSPENSSPVLSQSQLSGRWPHLGREWLLSSLQAACRPLQGIKPAMAMTCQG